jgi:6-phosphogluconolactonase
LLLPDHLTASTVLSHSAFLRVLSLLQIVLPLLVAVLVARSFSTSSNNKDATMSSAPSSSAETPLHVFGSTAALASDLQERLRVLSSEAISARGEFHVALSGGSLPATLAQALLGPADASTGQRAVLLDTSRWHFWFADERCVKRDDKESNYAECKKQLFDLLTPPVAPERMHAIDDALVDRPAEAAAAYEAALRAALPNDQALDVVLLGMGPDGHTCSLFPAHPLLKESTKLVAPITDSPKPPPQRITLTYPAIARARTALFVCTGAGKAEALSTVVRQRRAGTTAEDETVLPSSLVKAHSVVFLVDKDAASKLPSSL